MPATEQTWRNLNQLHVWFGVSSLVMLVATLWMLVVDHDREWKDYQRTFRNVETWATEARITSQLTADYEARRAELRKAVDAAAAAPLDPQILVRFLAEAETRAAQNGYDLRALGPPAGGGEPPRAAALAAMDTVIRKARFLEDDTQRKLKFKRADLDVVRSQLAIAIDEGEPAGEIAKIEANYQRVDGQVRELDLAYQSARTHRTTLDHLRSEALAAETAARKALSDHEGTLAQLERTLAEKQPSVAKTVLEAPVLDAFGRPLKIDQVWLPKLTWNNNFRDVARFDRCITCHQGIDKTAPGSAVDPAYPTAEELTLELVAPSQAPEPASSEAGDSQPLTERDIFGFQLAPRGVIRTDDVTVAAVWAETPAATADLRTGDVLLEINGVKVLNRGIALTYLVERVKWGQSYTLKLRRGVPQPYASHPRLDLFVGSMSPHKMGDMGCTVCHEGQGSGTDFKWASHTPNTPAQMAQWKRDHGWFHNHHWIFPMLPARFKESSCLKCHHEVTELEPSKRFPEPPAPKLVEGFHLVREYGCFGCHEINGWAGPTKRRGPDVRSEPMIFAAAQQVLADPAVRGAAADAAGPTELARLARQVVARPDEIDARKELARRIVEDRGSKTPVLGPSTHAMAGILGADDETPGQLRKVGPSLRHLASKVELPWLYAWVKEPAAYRPSTKMPQFFGLWDHLTPEPELDAQGQPKLDDHGHPVMRPSAGRAASERFEPIEILGISQYLLAASQPFDYIAPWPGITAPPSADRGRVQFQTRGCLACHQQSEFPGTTSHQGPNLTQLGGKLVGPKGRDWLYSWLRQPDKYHARTVMPNLYLEPITLADGKVSDPAADMVEYLLTVQQTARQADGQPQTGPDGKPLVVPAWQAPAVPQVDEAAIDELALMYLASAFTTEQAQKYLKEGIPESRRTTLKGDEQVLVGTGVSRDQKLLYIGRKSIGRLGCSGCHDIPGYEDAKPIGTGLADWGRKETSKLAFEQIVAYLHGKQAHHGGEADPHAGLHSDDPDEGFFLHALESHGREGFLWQKLREPRSFDYRKTETKAYTDRLRMPEFPFDAREREAVMTFVLGLVAEPPAAEYVFQPDPRRAAEIKGQDLLRKYNCTGCHTMQMDTWTFDFVPYDEDAEDTPGMLLPPIPFNDFAFLAPHFTPAQLAASKVRDRRGLGRATVTGMANPDISEDDDGNPVTYVALFEDVAIDGHAWYVGGQEIEIKNPRIVEHRPPVGGEFARYAHPVVLDIEKTRPGGNPNAKASDAWGWVPPPLVGEGRKVQTAWLHDFLLEPQPIRPAVFLRMPKFNMSSAEASAFADYFAAVDGATYPYEFDARTQPQYLVDKAQSYDAANPRRRFDDALRLIVDQNYCVKCHLVGDFMPQGSPTALAPNLDQVQQRLRPDYTLRWIGNPKRILPYTGMPQNFQMNKPADQALFHGTGQEQVEGVVDLLMNWDRFMQTQTEIKSRVKPVGAPPPAAPPAAPPPAGGGR